MPDVTTAQRTQRQARRLMARLAARQYGLVTWAQLRALGFSAAAIGRLVADGRLIRLHRGVYAVGHAVLRTEGIWLAAVLACGDGAVLSHRSAGALWQLGHATSPLVDVSANRARRPRHGIAVHHCRLDPADITTRRGIPVTTLPRTLLDLAECLPRAGLSRTIEQAMRLELYDRAALDATMDRAYGRHALRPLRACLDELDPTAARTKSELERLALPAIVAAGLPKPEVNVEVEGYEVDLVWRDARLAVELDSRTWHALPTAFERDRRRDADLQAAGWRVLRFTWRQLVAERAWVVTRIADLLA
ncbi:MAG TPA: type IV toxin-antitoxin system AbiEi family antitoxin domain-containing protein [Capillimicrobium sp.]|nr:type IV toxin-antitoxin system AbiEi family antitoxin domain-containing protein [Capillimicrobium sp.]